MADNKDSDHPVQLRRLIRVFVGRRCRRVRFLTLLLIRHYLALRKQAYSNILNISPTKTWKFADKNSDIFHISAKNLDC